MTAADTNQAPSAPSGEAGPAMRSPMRMAMGRFLRHRLAVAGAAALLIIVLAVVVLPIAISTTPNAVDLDHFRQPPSAAHWLGTDSAGRDVMARMLSGGRVSLGIGVTVAMLTLAFGIVLGAVAGTGGRIADSVIMRTADTVLAFPSVIVVIVVAGILGPSISTLIITIAAFEWPTTCRLVRGQLLTLRAQEFIQAARVLGVSQVRLVLRHYLPALLMPLSVVATLLVAQTVLLEAALSFLGLGVQPPQASWGNMLNEAQNLTLLETMPWLWLPPGLAIITTVLAVNFIGDGLRDAVDTRR